MKGKYKYCKRGRHLAPLSDFNFNSHPNKPGTERFDLEGPRQRRAMCKHHEIVSRKNHVSKAKRKMKKVASTHGGKSSSRQGVY